MNIRRSATGALVALAGVAGLTLLLLPLRDHLSTATTALVLVVPVVAGVAVGGFGAGLVAVVLGFLAYDFFFIRPYYTLGVGAAENWVALVVYVAVMLLVARIVSSLTEARAAARRREEDARRLYVLSELLMADRPLSELLDTVVSVLQQAFGAEWVALLLPDAPVFGEGALRVAATAGRPLTDEELARVAPTGGRIQSFRSPELSRVALSANGRPVGLLALCGAELDPFGWELVRTYANHAALAIDRSQLREQALRSELLEQVDHWRGALMGAVSHDLRTPLATMKAAVSTLRQGPQPDPADRAELLALIEQQTDRLDRLVSNLLDMTRIESGALELRKHPIPLAELVRGALELVSDGEASDGRVKVSVPDDVVDVDDVLMTQVLANLIDNALRHSPADEPVEVSGAAGPDGVELAVADHGPGVPWADRQRIFQLFNRSGRGERAGLGLAIAKSFVEAHGGSITVGDTPGGGARFVVTL